MKKRATLLPLLITVALLAIVALSFAASPATAGELPPRPETPTPPAPSPDIEGAPLILQATGEEPFPSGAWTVVQWQTGLGTWVDVESWQGEFNSSDLVIWWVGSDNFGESPFRWQVYDGPQRGTLLATSEEFTLPQYDNHTVLVTVAPGDGTDS